VELAFGVTQQLRDVPQSFAVFEPQDGGAVPHRPVLAVEPENSFLRRGGARGDRWARDERGRRRRWMTGGLRLSACTAALGRHAQNPSLAIAIAIGGGIGWHMRRAGVLNRCDATAISAGAV